MLNYIWVALIVIGIVTAIAIDIADEARDTFRNGQSLEAEFIPEKQPGAIRSDWQGVLVIPGNRYSTFYGVENPRDTIHGTATISGDSLTFRAFSIAMDNDTPALWRTMAASGTARDKLAGVVESARWRPDKSSATLRIVFDPVRFVKLRAVTQAAFDYAGTAVTIALGLIGIMALWLGVMKVAEEAGVLKVVARVLAPLMRRIFPDVPPDHPAASAMIMNIAANMLGLSNAATPLGLKAMEELNKLNPKAGTATNAMCTFLAINTGGLVLLPATALAVRVATGSANPGIIIGTSIVGAGCATIAGVCSARILQRLPVFRRTIEVDND
jgi:spore maturation protein A